MDLGAIFNIVSRLYSTLWNASFTIYGISFTWGEVVSYGIFISIVLLLFSAIRS